MIDRELKSKKLISFDFDFEGFNPDNIFEVDSFLNLKSSKETFIQEQYIYLKENIADHLSEQIRRYWKKNNIRYYLIKTIYKKDRLVIKSRENFGIDFTDKSDIRICLSVMFALAFVIYRILPPRIVEEIITVREQKSQCLFATSVYNSAWESYDRKFKSSLSQFSPIANPRQIHALNRQAQELALYSRELELTKKEASKDFWGEKVKPNSTLYRVNDSIYLNRDDAEKSLDN